MAKNMVIEKTVTINKDVTTVFNFLKQTKNQDLFSVWNMKDPKMHKTYSGTDGTNGFIYSWDSKDKNVGAGTQQIINIVENNRIEYVINFERPMKNTGNSIFSLNTSGDNSTTVSWSFISPTKFPFSLLAPLFKKMLGKQIETSLQNLKQLLEKK
jgi:uncharacterized protein YndB with AHSA1/START domain